jgi:D-alanyl-lipoteichoic acid acyltransferase DltB (MBOAT superfamily)
VAIFYVMFGAVITGMLSIKGLYETWLYEQDEDAIITALLFIVTFVLLFIGAKLGANADLMMRTL